ncbi:FtsX-like permease family protein [Streptosporangium sandarakinum]|uniref:FtsX-like permease family protein n=1 Tax=Streptosporangium sandarakinum TaxID=1260955 RepID=UPI003D93DFA7
MNPWPLVRAHRGVAAVLLLLTLSACLLLAAVPKATRSAYDGALHDVTATAAAGVGDLVVVSPRRAGPDAPVTRGSLLAMERSLRAALPAELSAVTAPPGSGSGHHSLRKTREPIASVDGEPRNYQYLDLGWLSDAAARVRYVAGRPPGPPARLGDGPLLEVALAREPAAEMRLGVGATVLLGGPQPLAARVSGLFEPVRPGDRYWEHNTSVRRVVKIRPPRSEIDDRYVTGLVSDASLPVLGRLYANTTYRWVFDIDRPALRAARIPKLAEAVRAFRGAVPVAIRGSSPGALETSFDELLTGYLGRVRAADALLLLVLGGLMAVALGVIALAVRLLGDRMRLSLALARARGASLARVAATATAVTSAAAVPGAAAGYALSYAVPGEVTAVTHLGPLSVAAAAALFAAGQAVAAHRLPLGERRADVAAVRPSPRRIAAEAAVVVVALIGAYLLRSRGLGTGTGGASGPGGGSAPGTGEGTDPFPLLAPAGLAVAAALVVLRCHSLPLRLAVRLAARTRSAVPFLGLALAARSRPVSALPVLVLLPALAVSVFGATVSGELTATQEAAAWQRTGAPARLDADLPFSPEAIERVRRVPGVRRVLPATRTSVRLDEEFPTATVLAVDVRAYRAVLRDAPVVLPDAPVLVSPELAGRGAIEAPGVPPRLSPGGVVTGLAAAYGSGPLIVVPPGGALPNTLLVEGDGLDGGRLLAAAAQPGALARTFEGALTEITRTPLTTTFRRALAVVTAALACYALAAVAVALVAGAADRAGALSHLCALGLPESQARRLTVLEVSPMILLSTAAGLLLGLALPAVLGPGLDLRVFTGDLAAAGRPPGPAVPVLLACGVAAATVLGAFLHPVPGRRGSLGTALRAGDLG